MEGDATVTATFDTVTQPPAAGPLFFSEFMLDPGAAGVQWLEITNAGDLDANAGGVQLSVSNPAGACTLPDGLTVPAHGQVVIGEVGQSYPFPVAASCDIPLPTEPFSNGSTYVSLLTADGVLYQLALGASWPAAANGQTIFLKGQYLSGSPSDLQASFAAGAWCASIDGGTPGAPNPPTCP
jgi:hypothetical protein